MPGCGYVCPKCNDTGFDEDLKPCDWCSVSPELNKKNTMEDTEDWIRSVHEGPCCGDLGREATTT